MDFSLVSICSSVVAPESFSHYSSHLVIVSVSIDFYRAQLLHHMVALNKCCSHMLMAKSLDRFHNSDTLTWSHTWHTPLGSILHEAHIVGAWRYMLPTDVAFTCFSTTSMFLSSPNFLLLIVISTQHHMSLDQSLTTLLAF